MSGIVGLLDRGNGGIETDELATMHERLSHRGPDGAKTWCDDAIGLGHQLLATTPEAQYDHQPVRNGSLVVTADARLDNRGELLETLPVSTARTPIPDSELLLAAYREWGEQCVDHLIGAFAFAVWDQDKGSVFCARDHMGVKPLYYHCDEDLFAFATEQKALLTLPSVTYELDETKVGDFLTGTFEDTKNTFYTGIRRLPPAHAMVVGVGEDDARMRQYWDLDPTRTITLESDAAYERRFRELLEQAVQCRLRTNDSIGTTLSGGLDSSSITAVARDLLPPDTTLQTFSGVFDDIPSCDEREYIETLVERDGIDPSYVIVDDLSPVAHIDQALEYHDEPISNTMHYMKWALTERASSSGVGVVLDGANGDNAVDYGLGRLPELARTGRWLTLVRELQAMGDVLGVSPRWLFRQHVAPWLVPARIRSHYRRLRGKPVDERLANSTLDPSFVRRIDLRSRYRELTSEGAVHKRSARRWQYRSLKSGDIVSFFEANDLTNAAFGIEPRYPFTDKRLIEFSLAIPPTQQLADGWTRMILRRSLADVLPEKIRWRPWKTLLNPAFTDGLARETQRLESHVTDSSRLDRYLDGDRLAEAYERYTREPNARDVDVLWKALSLSMWFDTGGDRSDSPMEDRVRPSQ